MNLIQTWAQGRFVRMPQNRHISPSEAVRHEAAEKCAVRSAPTANAVCHTARPEDAKWIAARLNLASKLEQMSYDFATGKSDGSEIIEFVMSEVG